MEWARLGGLAPGAGLPGAVPRAGEGGGRDPAGCTAGERLWAPAPSTRTHPWPCSVHGGMDTPGGGRCLATPRNSTPAPSVWRHEMQQCALRPSSVLVRAAVILQVSARVGPGLRLLRKACAQATALGLPAQATSLCRAAAAHAWYQGALAAAVAALGGGTAAGGALAPGAPLSLPLARGSRHQCEGCPAFRRPLLSFLAPLHFSDAF